MKSADPLTTTATTPGPLANFAALGSSEVIARAVGFYATALLARRLGAESFGYLGFAVTVISYVGVALTVGFGDIGAREIARNPGSARQTAADATAVRLGIATFGIALIAGTVAIFISSPIQGLVLMLSSIALIPLALDTTWVYRGLARNRTAAAALLIAQMIYVAGAILFIHGPGDVVRVPFVQFAGEIVAAIGLLVLVFRGGFPKPSLAGGLSLLRQSGFITLSRLLRTLIVTFDVLLLAFLTTSREVGLYTAAYRVCLLVTAVAVTTHVVFLPRITRAAAIGRSSLSGSLTKSISLTSAVILPIVVGGILLARPLLIFLFGPDYSLGATAFRILLASIAVLAIHGTTHNVFVALHQTKKEAAIFGCGAAINVALNLVLIPRYQLAGAAFSTLGAEVLILAAVAVALYRNGIRPDLSPMLLPALATAGMAVMLAALGERVPVWAAIPLGGLTYLSLFGAGGGIRRERDDWPAGEGATRGSIQKPPI